MFGICFSYRMDLTLTKLCLGGWKIWKSWQEETILILANFNNKSLLYVFAKIAARLNFTPQHRTSSVCGQKKRSLHTNRSCEFKYTVRVIADSRKLEVSLLGVSPTVLLIRCTEYSINYYYSRSRTGPHCRATSCSSLMTMAYCITG